MEGRVAGLGFRLLVTRHRGRGLCGTRMNFLEIYGGSTTQAGEIRFRTARVCYRVEPVEGESR